MKNRPYKEAHPKVTIRRIQQMLSEVDMLVSPVYWGNPYDEIFSVRIEAIDEDGVVGTNGKGRTKLYALASAYAEYIERLQNQLIFGATGFSKTSLDIIYDNSEFYYFPDEKPLKLESFVKLPKDIMNDLFGGNSDELQLDFLKIFERPSIKKKGGIISVPFYNVTKRKVEYLPYNLIYSYTGSNGMAAGNTIAEATFQAMCEIFERHAASIIYYNNLTPPTITKRYLKGLPEELNIILSIEGNGFEVIVKDFSCNKRFPVIGLIIIDTLKKKYKLNVGSDTSLKIALSRTLTEIYQGIRDINEFRNSMLDFPDEKNAPYLFDERQKMEQELNLANFMRDGQGYFPPSLFSSESSYLFDPTVFESKESYEEEVKSMFLIAKDAGYNIFIRDVSFLGFPSVYIYIPKVSIIGRKNVALNKHTTAYVNNFDELDGVVFPFYSFLYSNDRIYRAIHIIEGLCNSFTGKIAMKDLLHLRFKKNTSWNNVTVNFFLSILCSLVREYDKAISYVQFFLGETDNTDSVYYNECIRYFELKRDGKPVTNIDPEIVESFKNPESVFQFIGYPNCPKCSSCKLVSECLTTIHVDKTIKFNGEFKKTNINQNKFSIYCS